MSYATPKTCRWHNTGMHGQSHIHISKKIKTQINLTHPPTNRTHKVRRSSWEVKGLIHPAWQNVHFQNPAVMKWKHTHQKVTEEALENGKWTLKEGGGRGEKKPIYTAYHTHGLMSNTISQNHIILYLSQNVCITVAYGWIIYDVCVFRNDGWKDWRGVQNFFFIKVPTNTLKKWIVLLVSIISHDVTMNLFWTHR